MKQSIFDYDNYWRPIYEARQSAAWLTAAGVSLASLTYTPLPVNFALVTAGACSVIAAFRLNQTWDRYSNRERSSHRKKTFITIDELIVATKTARETNCVYLGKGFQWTDIESNKMHALVNMGVAKTLGKKSISQDGNYWIHGLGKEEDVLVDLGLLEGHTLITGSTGVGKTRLFDVLIAQAILRDEVVIIIDPKGDEGLARNAERICERMGRPDKFVYFNPAHPNRSVSIDPMINWNRKTELASRVAALIPSETGADPFTAFGWKVINDIVGGLIASGERPNLIKLRRYIESGPDDLLLKALRSFFRRSVNEWEAKSASFVKAKKGDVLAAYIDFYKQVVIHENPNVDLQGLITTFEHNRDHFQKMVASLIPILSMLTSEAMGELLSPDFEPGHNRVQTDMAQIIRNKQVCYLGLDSLTDATVGSAIGSIILSDLTAVAGDRYNYGIKDDLIKINVFVDEAAEVINNPTIQLLNKGRGAGFRMFIATQTFADFAARLGDENKALQVLANTNNKITLRLQDSKTQKFITDGIPQIVHHKMSVQYGHNTEGNIQENYEISYKEASTPEAADLIPPGLFGELPPLHFFARLSGGKTIKGIVPILI